MSSTKQVDVAAVVEKQPSWDEALNHLQQADERLAALILKVGPCTLEIPHHFSIFYSLARSIVYQQLAGKAAAAIFGRVEALFPAGQMTPERLLELSDEKLRRAGLSQNKMLALRDLASKCLDGTVPTTKELAELSDEEIIERVSQVRGIGKWTVEMMLMFRLGRPNVLPVDDYGVRKGMQLIYRMRELPKKDAMIRKAKKWEPWRTVGSWYMWRALELPDSKPKKKAAKKAAKKVTKKAAQKAARTRTNTAAKKKSR